SFVAALALVVLLWSFNLDDKWAYYRSSKSVLIEGVPNYNPGEWLNVNTSFIYPYLMAPGHFFGDYRDWETWSKLVGLAFHFGTAILIVAVFGAHPGPIVKGPAFILYPAALPWSPRGPAATTAVIVAHVVPLFSF